MRNLTLSELVQVVGEQERKKRDFLVETGQLTMKTENGVSYLHVPAGRGTERFTLNETARAQLADRLEIPLRFAEHLCQEHPALLDQTVNTLFRSHPEKRLVRTLGDHCRAILSPKYKILDNYAFIGSVVPALAGMPDVEVKECFLTDTHMQLSLTFNKAQAIVQVGDPVCYGVLLQNSEVGVGSLSAASYIWRKVCGNGLVIPQVDGPAMRRYHLGKRIDDLSRLPNDREVWMAYQDHVRNIAARSRFPQIVSRLQSAAQTPIADHPVELVEKLSKRYQLTKEESELVLDRYIAGHDLTLWGMVNSVTEVAKEAATVQRRVDLQTIGGKMLFQDDLLKAA